MGKFEGASTTAGGVLNGDIGDEVAATHVALGAGWGNTATVAVTAGSNAQRGRLTITSGGTGQSQATATVTLTFPNPYDTAPFCIQKDTTNDNSLTTHTAFTCTLSATAPVFTHTVLPVDTKIYILDYAFAK